MRSDHDYHVFLAHDSLDKNAVTEIAKRLTERKLNPFLDRWHLVPGRPVQSALVDAIAQCGAVAVFFGPKTVGKWRDREAQLALDIATSGDKRVFAVLLPGARKEDVRGFVQLNLWVDLKEHDGFTRLLAGVLDCRPSDVPPASVDPRPRRWTARVWGAIRGVILGTGPSAPQSQLALGEAEAEARTPETGAGDKGVEQQPVGPDEKIPWDAVAELTTIVLEDDSGVVERIAARLGGTSAAPTLAARVAETIDGLGHGLPVAKTLIESCYHAVREVQRHDGEQLPGALTTVRKLLRCWLPRRAGDESTVWRRSRRVVEPDECANLVVKASSNIMVAVLVAGEDGVELRLVERGEEGLVGEGSLPLPTAQYSRLSSAGTLADELGSGFAKQFPGQFSPGGRGLRQGARHHFAVLRALGSEHSPKYFAPWPHQVAPEVLAELEAIYPTLRIVYRGESMSYDEAYIMEVLVKLFSAWETSPSA